MINLETKRLSIRNFKCDDWQALYEMIVQYQSTEYAAYDQQWPITQEEIKEIAKWFAGGDHFLAVCLKDKGQFIGFVALNPEERDGCHEFNLGYIFNSDCHGKGYATEACKAALNHAFGPLQAEKVVSGTAAVNQASRRLLERLGFRRIGEKMSSFKTAEDGKPIEFLGYHYAVSKKEWAGNSRVG